VRYRQYDPIVWSRTTTALLIWQKNDIIRLELDCTIVFGSERLEVAVVWFRSDLIGVDLSGQRPRLGVANRTPKATDRRGSYDREHLTPRHGISLVDQFDGIAALVLTCALDRRADRCRIFDHEISAGLEPLDIDRLRWVLRVVLCSRGLGYWRTGAGAGSRVGLASERDRAEHQ